VGGQRVSSIHLFAFVEVNKFRQIHFFSHSSLSLSACANPNENCVRVTTDLHAAWTWRREAAGGQRRYWSLLFGEFLIEQPQVRQGVPSEIGVACNCPKRLPGSAPAIRGCFLWGQIERGTQAKEVHRHSRRGLYVLGFGCDARN
jgi:hypothetical protein